MYSITTKIQAFSNRYKVPLLFLLAFVIALNIAYLPIQPSDVSRDNNPFVMTPTPSSNATSGWILQFNERYDGETPDEADFMYRMVDTNGNYIKDLSETEVALYTKDAITFWKLKDETTDTTSTDYSLTPNNKYIIRAFNNSKISTIEVAENNGKNPVFKMLASSNKKEMSVTYLGYIGNDEHLFSYDSQIPGCSDDNGEAICSHYQTFYVGKAGETPKKVNTPKNTSLTSEFLQTVIGSRYAIIGGQIEGGARRLFIFDRQTNAIEDVTKDTIFLIDDIQSWPYIVDKTNSKIYSIVKVTSTSYTISSYDIATKKKSTLSIVKPPEKINTDEGNTSISMNISPSDSYLYIEYTPAKAQDGTIFNIFSLTSKTIVFTSDTDYYDLAQDLGSWDLNSRKQIAFDTTIYDLTDEANPTVSELSYSDAIQRSYKSFTIFGYWKK